MEEENKIIDVDPEQPSQLAKKKKPIGAVVLGGINLVIFGIVPLIYSFSPRAMDEFMAIMEQNTGADIGAGSTAGFRKIAMVIQGAVSLFFIISGVGLIFRKEWARRATLYFSFLMVIMIVLTAVLQPALISQVIVQIVYPGVLIFYFTNKKVKEYFQN